MKHLQLYEWFGNKPKEGDELVKKILNIVKEEGIKVQHTGGFRVDIDDKVYSFADFGDFGHDCRVSIYDKKQEINTQQYGKILSGNPISSYKFSGKLWKELEKLYKEETTQINKDLDELDDVVRKANKYNL